MSPNRIIHPRVAWGHSKYSRRSTRSPKAVQPSYRFLITAGWESRSRGANKRRPIDDKFTGFSSCKEGYLLRVALAWYKKWTRYDGKPLARSACGKSAGESSLRAQVWLSQLSLLWLGWMKRYISIITLDLLWVLQSSSAGGVKNNFQIEPEWTRAWWVAGRPKFHCGVILPDS